MSYVSPAGVPPVRPPVEPVFEPREARRIGLQGGPAVMMPIAAGM